MNTILTRNRVIVALCVLLSFSALAKAQGYRGIVPMGSNCRDVERQLGLKACGLPKAALKNESEQVSFYMSVGACHEAFKERWDVPVGTVIGIYRLFNTSIALEELRLDLSRFEKHPVKSDILDQYYYLSPEQGMGVSTIGTSVESIVYFPTSTDQERRCLKGEFADEQPEEVQVPGVVFDRYGDLPLNKEKERLVSLAHQLMATPQYRKVYILVHSGGKLSKEVARSRGERTKRELVYTFGIAEDRITLVEGNKREEFELVIQLNER